MHCTHLSMVNMLVSTWHKNSRIILTVNGSFSLSTTLKRYTPFRIWTWKPWREELCVPTCYCLKAWDEPYNYSGHDSWTPSKELITLIFLSLSLRRVLNQAIKTCSFLLFKDSGAYMEHRFAGPRAVTILGLNTGTIDLTQNGWGYQVKKWTPFLMSKNFSNWCTKK